MNIEDLICGKYYELTMDPGDADVEEYLEMLKKYSGTAKLMAISKIEDVNRKKQPFEFLIFKHEKTKQIFEFFAGHSNNFYFVTNYNGKDYDLEYMSDYITPENIDFPEFGGPYTICENVVTIANSNCNT